MTTRQGDLTLLEDPVAQRLLQSTLPARLAYVWTDGTPRVVPIAFHWNGADLVLGTPPDAPKMRALHDGTKVAVSIDTDTMPYEVLQIRGSVRTDVVDGIAPEYEATTLRTLGDQAGRAWLENMRPISPADDPGLHHPGVGRDPGLRAALPPGRSNAPWSGREPPVESRSQVEQARGRAARPPPLVAVAAALAQRALTGATPRPRAARAAATAVVASASLSMAGASAGLFRRSGTTVDPLHPDRASALVTAGPNAISRNPMYVGMAGMLLAHAVWRGSWAALLPLGGFVLLVDRLQVEAEQSALLDRFGGEYEAYRASTPRWIGPRSLGATRS